MKFSVDKSLLLKEVSIAQEIIASRNNMSILSNVLLDVSDGSLKIKATDLKVSFETVLPVQETVPGTTTVFCDKFLGILRTLPEGEVEFELGEGGKLFIRPLGKSIQFHLKSLSSEKFPETAHVDEDRYFELSQATVLEMISQTIFSVSDDESRYFMNGVYLEKKEGKLIMVATDGRRLSYIEKDMEISQDFSGIIIPPKALHLIRKLASGQGNMYVAVVDKSIFLKFDNQKISSNLIDAQFPNYTRVIPETQPLMLKVRKDDLQEALKRVSLLAEQKSKRIYLTVADHNILMNSEESDIGMAKEEIPCEYDGPQTVLALNYTFLQDPLKVISDNALILKFTDSKKAVTLTTDPQKDFFHIIMPMQTD